MMDSIAQIRYQVGSRVPVIVVLVSIIACSCSSEFQGELFTAMPECSEGAILPVTPVNSDFVSSRGQCLANCLGDSTCMSVNLCEDSQSGQVCHRLPETSNGSCSDLQSAVGCVFLEPVNVCQHGGRFNDSMSKCDCYDDFTGTYCERRYRDCSEAYAGGLRGVGNSYRNIPIRPLLAPREYQVECYLASKGWSVVGSRGTNCQEDYNKTWSEYKNGWGTSCSVWLGLEAIHYITNQATCQLYVMVNDNLGFYYRSFRLDDEANSYTLTYTTTYSHATKHTGNGFEYGEPNKSMKGEKFATWDHPDSSGCALSDGTGWWYGTVCPDTNLHKNFTTSAVQWPDDGDVLHTVMNHKLWIKVSWP
ncbi:fibrinogen-like protein 1 [Haliotis rufescens]|uniref:fibrinogen-like protein 1 n=1 Tax=Haliotis rufescens TaxID=6454 RepID=UPI00201FAF80|nr:fibrinogen-like protein 1 [Haliotis rufescens]